MKAFLDLADRFRSTPIVDDEFPRLRDEFDSQLFRMRTTLPKIVCLCGSTRFVDSFNYWRRYLTEKGEIVLSIEIVTTQTRENDPQYSDPELKQKLDELHKRKIDLADEILVLNVGGYIGESTRSEIEYAQNLGKSIRYLEVANAGV
jgi:cell division protein FtsB